MFIFCVFYTVIADCWYKVLCWVNCIRQCGSLIYLYCAEKSIFKKGIMQRIKAGTLNTENYSPTNPIIYHFIISVCTLELPWADYNLAKKKKEKKNKANFTSAEHNVKITVWWHTHVLKKLEKSICSQSQEGRQAAELQPVLVCVCVLQEEKVCTSAAWSIISA